MSAIAGIILKASNSYANWHVKQMIKAIAHRGHNNENYWSNYKNTVHFGQRQLAVTPQNTNGTYQTYNNNRYQLVCDGEIYNYIEIKSFLQNKGFKFYTQNHAEVILAAYEFWKERCLQHFDGVFAFAIWDEKDETFFAARDRFGQKPFYYYEDEEHFVFGSEMKALWAIGVEKRIDKKMMFNYITLGHVQNCIDKEQTFFEETYSLPPSYYLTFKPSTDKASKITRYWSINKELKIDIGITDAIDKFTELFSKSIARQYRTETVAGACLGGGIDSCSIAAIIHSYIKNENKSNALLKTFTAVFPGFEKDESPYIDLFNKRYTTENFRVYTTVDDLIRDFEKLCFHQEEPFPSTSTFSQYKVFEAAKNQDVKILFDGHGADEILAGYPGYIHWYLQEVISRHKLGSTRKERLAFKNNGQQFIWDFKNYMAAFLPSHAAMALEKREYLKTIHHPFINTDFLRLMKGREWEGIHKPIVTKLNDILYFSTCEMGLEQLLRFTDRNSMAHGIQIRMPFLNHELVEFIFTLPSPFKMHDGWTKFLLRKAMDKKLPDEIIWRKDKVGFETPQINWMENSKLQEYIHVSKQKLVSFGILSKKILENKVVALPVTSRNNYDWRYLCAAQII